MSTAHNDKFIIFFDGTCAFCNAWVQFVLKRDQKLFYFSTLQGDAAKQCLPEELTKDLDTVVLWKKGLLLTKSDAVLGILSELGGFWRLMVVFKVFSKTIRDFAYQGVARMRHRLLKKSSCTLPSQDERKRFLK